MNAMHWADRNLKTLGDFDAFVSGDRKQSSVSASDSERRMAAALLDMGLAPSDRVLLWMPNGPDLSIAWRAIIRAGGTTVVAHHDAPLNRIEQITAETTPRAIITSSRIGAKLNGTTIRHRIQTRSDEQHQGWQDMNELIAGHLPLIEPVARMGSDIASIIHTSGTTGEPKGLVTRHEALTSRMRNLRPRFAPARQTTRHLVMLPMSSAFGSYAFTLGLLQKCTLHFLGEFDPTLTLETIQRYRIHQTFLVPAMCEAILALPNIGDYDVSSLRSVVCSGAPVSRELVSRFRSALGVRLEVGYGMSGVGIVSRTGLRSNPGSVGRVKYGMDARVEDANGTPLPPGETGELVLKLRDGAGIEHWNSDSSVTSVAAPGEWYRTGDIVRFDSRGDLHVVGRGDDLIIQGGHNIHGQFVAQVVQRLATVRDCAVVGVPSEYLGQEAVICAELEDNARVTAAEILAYCRLHLEPGSVPASVWFAESLPRTDLGKVKFHELRSSVRTSRGTVRDTEFLRELRAAPAASRLDLIRSKVRQMVESVLRTSAGTGSTTFRDMSLDSLGSVELTSLLSEAIGRPLSATLTYSYPTIDEVSGFLLHLLDGARAKNGRIARHPNQRTPSPREPSLRDFFSSRDLENPRRSISEGNTANDSRSILLTGANGFLGRFLTLEILNSVTQNGAKLHCLVRAADESSALARLRSAYSSDPLLQDQFENLRSGGRLTVLAGDFTKPHFGLADDRYDQLSAEIDCVIHNGAVVDHVLGYDELYAPNVLGTVEVIRFALAERMKRISYVSTIAVQGIRSSGAWSTPGEIASGYVAGKWASERLLNELRENHGVPVRIFRPGQIFAHQAYHGQINTRDTLTRLLLGLVTTSLAPRSFYEPQFSKRAEPFLGLPVDVVAKSIAAASVTWDNNGAGNTRDVMNASVGVNLDAMTEWVRSAGYRIDTVADYSGWHSEFANRLGSLKAPDRQRSLLPLVHAWERPLRGKGPYSDTHRGTHGRTSDSPVNEALIHKWLDDMRVLGLIGPAE